MTTDIVGGVLINFDNLIDCKPINSNLHNDIVTMLLIFNSGENVKLNFSRQDAYRLLLLFNSKKNPDKYKFKKLNLTQ